MDDAAPHTIKRLCEDLGLPAGDAYTQDWVYELPPAFRSREFFGRYLAAYMRPDYGDEERRLLMQVMLDVANDMLGSPQEDSPSDENFRRMLSYLRRDCAIHRETIEYLASAGVPLEDTFPLTPSIRALQADLPSDSTRRQLF